MVARLQRFHTASLVEGCPLADGSCTVPEILLMLCLLLLFLEGARVCKPVGWAPPPPWHSILVVTLFCSPVS